MRSWTVSPSGGKKTFSKKKAQRWWSSNIIADCSECVHHLAALCTWEQNDKKITKSKEIEVGEKVSLTADSIYIRTQIVTSVCTNEGNFPGSSGILLSLLRFAQHNLQRIFKESQLPFLCRLILEELPHTLLSLQTTLHWYINYIFPLVRF